MRKIKFKRRIATALLSLCRNSSYSIFYGLRVRWLKMLGAKIGYNVKVKPGVFIEYADNLEIGNNVSIQHNCFISAYDKIRIGDNVSIAHGVSILTSTHPYDTACIIRNSPLIKAPVMIGNNVWIGMKSSLLSGVEIGTGSVIGAHSLVTKSVPKNKVVAGAPAKIIKERFNNQ